jgi:hypothetical protein
MIQTAAAGFWNIAEFITICVRKRKSGITPGAHVALELLLWLSLAAGMGIMCVSASSTPPGTSYATAYYQTAVQLDFTIIAFMAMLM